MKSTVFSCQNESVIVVNIECLSSLAHRPPNQQNQEEIQQKRMAITIALSKDDIST